MNTLLQWFVTSSVLILAVLALRRLLGGRISPRVKYALWGVVLLRLLVPFQIPMPNLPTAADLTPEPTSLTQTTIPILPSSYSMEEVEAGQAPNLYLNDQGQVHTANSTGTVKPSADGQRAVFPWYGSPPPSFCWGCGVQARSSSPWCCWAPTCAFLQSCAAGELLWTWMTAHCRCIP